jgi:nucleoside 2-deoxyribosyltransferase
LKSDCVRRYVDPKGGATETGLRYTLTNFCGINLNISKAYEYGTSMTPCPVCENILNKSENRVEITYNECPRCGAYSISTTAIQTLPYHLKSYERSRAILSHALYKLTQKEQWAKLNDDLIVKILNNTNLPNHTEQLDNLIVWIATKQPKYGGCLEKISIDSISAVGTEDIASFNFVMNHAITLGFVSAVSIGVYGFGVEFSDVSLTFAGWSRLDEIQRGSTITRLAFMAMKFNDSETDIIYKDHFKLAVAACGFELKRLDDSQPAGLIDDRMRVEIRQSRFMIADLTHQNNGAYWEAGYAEGLGKPVIYTCRKDVFDKGTHFDTNHHLTVVWESDKLQEAVEKLKNTIRATLPSEAKLSD